MSGRGGDSTSHNSDAKRNSFGSTASNQQQRKPVVGAPPSTTTSAPRTTTDASKKPGAPTTTVAPGGKQAVASYVPKRTNSAPPEEHPSEAPKQQSHFQPTKTTSMTGEHHSYRTALGIKSEQKEESKPKVESSKPVEVSAPQEPQNPEPVPEFEPAPVLTEPTYNPEIAQVDGGNVAHEYGDKNAGDNRDGNRNNRNSNPNRRTNRSDSYDRNANRPPRNNNQQQQQQQQQAMAQQQMQQQYYYSMPQQQQQQQQQYMTQQQWQAYLASLPPEYQYYYQQQYYQYAQQYAAAARMQAQYSNYYNPMMQQQMMYSYYPQATVPMQTQMGYQTAPAAPKMTIDESAPQQAPTTNTIASSSPQLRAEPAPYVPPAQLPQAQQAAVPAVAPVQAPVATQPPPAPVVVTPPAPVKVEEIKPPARKPLKVTTKTGEQWIPEKVVKSAESVTPKEPAAPETKAEESVKAETAPAVVSDEAANAIPDIPVTVQKKKKAEPVTEAPTEPSVPFVEKPAENKVEAHADSWDENDVSIPSLPVSTEQRRLVPQKSKFGQPELNQSAKRKTYVYTKADIFALRPNEETFQKIPNLIGSIQCIGDGAPAAGGQYGGKPQANYGGGKHGGRGGGAGGRGGDYNRGDQSPVRPGQGQEGWTREQLPPPKKNKAQAPAAPPKKKEADPIEQFKHDITLILNIITPKTYDKLSKEILAFPLQNTLMLDTLVELIFEKAIYDPPAYTPMYADLCLLLKEQSNWLFFTVARLFDANEYFWIRDFTFPEEAAGPFFSQADAINAFNTDGELPAMKPLSSPISPQKPPEVILVKNNLLKLMLNMQDQYFVTCVSIDAIPMDQRAQSVYPTEKEAHKEASTDLSFRGRLAHSCEIEFQKSVKDESLFEQIDENLKQLKIQRSTGKLSPEEYEAQEAEIMEQRGKIKRRMIGNIRFVGELYKKKLLNTETMHDCIGELLGHPPAWKPSYDEQELELLCDLLETIGETLESKTKKLKKDKGDYHKKFEQYFDRIKALSKDKVIISRIRFKLEGMIEFRNNGWQKRKPQDAAPQDGKAAADERQSTNTNQRGQSNAPLPSQRTILVRPGEQANSRGDARTRDSYDARGDRRDNREQPDSGRYSNSGRYGNEDNRSGKSSGNFDDKRNRNDVPSKQPAAKSATPSSSAAPQAAPSSSASSIPSEADLAGEEFRDNGIRRGLTASIDEILSGVEMAELRATLRESSALHTGYFVQVILERYATGSASQRDKLLAILDDAELISWLVQYSVVVEKALENLESLRGLVDTKVDAVQAPELFGVAVNKLLKTGVLTNDKISRLLAKWKAFNLEEMGYTQEEIDEVFDKFTAKLN